MTGKAARPERRRARGITRIDRAQSLTASAQQEGLWLLETAGEGGPRFNVPIAWEIKGPLDERRLQDGLDAIVARHESLRTRYSWRHDQLVQLIDPPAPVPMRIETIDRERLTAAIDAAARTPLDLSAGPVFRAFLYRLAPNEHTLVLLAHHIAVDGWSIATLAKDLSRFYNDIDAASGAGGDIDYADYAQFQKQWLAETEAQSQETFWRHALQDAPADLFAGRRETTTPGLSARTFTLDRQTSRALANLARQTGASTFMLLLAAFQATLSRWSGQRDVVVGCPVSGRKPQTAGIVGFFVNSLPLRIEIKPQESFARLLERVKERALDAYENAELPFERMVAAARPDRRAGRHPIFQVTMNHEVAGEPTSLSFDGLDIRPLPANLDRAKLDIALSWTETDTGLAAVLECDAARFAENDATQFADDLQHLLQKAATNPEDALARLWIQTHPPLGAQQRETGFTINELFDARVSSAPDSIAIAGEAGDITYAELDASARAWANRLSAAGLGADSIVALALPRSPAIVTAMLAAWRLGAAYLPLDPDYPDARLAWMMDDAAPACLITTQDIADRLPVHPLTFFVDELNASAPAKLAPLAEVVAASSAYIIYTSGSTGAPKGVVVTHAGVANLVRAQHAQMKVGPGARVLLFASPSFDASFFEVCAALLSGATLVVASKEELHPGPPLARLAQATRASHLTLPPSALHAMPKDALASCRTIVVAGEACSKALAEQWGPSRRFINAYGPTEATVCTSMSDPLDGSSEPTIGAPFAGVEAHVLDEAMTRVPPGVLGELFVGGPGVARGYLNRPALTASRFVPNPFASDGSRLYATGDLCRVRRDGQIEFIGRADRQVKLRGFRVELGEIEAQLTAIANIDQAAVIVNRDRLEAFVSGDCKAREIGQRLDVLPAFMRPALIHVVDALPRTSNGKTDYKALTLLAEQETVEAPASEPPHGIVEETIAEVWRRLLKLERIDRQSDFFELGGHSLLAAQAVTQVSEALGRHVELSALFGAPRLAAFAAAVSASESQTCSHRAPAVESPVAPLPLSLAQRRLFFLERMGLGGTLYAAPLAIRIRGPLDVATLSAALTIVVARHPALRARFLEVDGAPAQTIAPAQKLELTAVPLAGNTLEAELRASASRPLDLSAAPFRADLYCLAEDEHVLLLVMHHIITDAVSAQILRKELFHLYARLTHGVPPPAPAEDRYVEAILRTAETSARAGMQSSFWRAHLKDAPLVHSMPVSRPRGNTPALAGEYLSFSIGRDRTAALKELARRHGASLFMAVMASFQLALSMWSGRADVIVGFPLTSRRADLADTVGFFLNTLPFRTTIDPSKSFKSLLSDTRARLLQVYACGDISFEHLVEEINAPRSLSHHPLFQVMLSLQSEDASHPQDVSGLRVEEVGVFLGVSKFDLALGLSERDGGLVGGFEYAADLFDADAIEKFAERFHNLIGAVVSESAAPSGRLSWLDQAALRADAQRSKGPALAVAPGATLVQVIEANAGAHPQRIAVNDGASEISYQELDRRANRAAAWLCARGLMQGDIVAVELERGVELIVAMLAVLKAGGAYLPLDPASPPARRRFMTDDAGAKVLIGKTGGEAPLRASIAQMTADADTLCAEPIRRTLHRDSIAYVIYTSGSSGLPKGVAATHANALNRILSQPQAATSAEPEIWLQKTSIGFVDSVYEMLSPLCRAATLAIAPDETTRDPRELLRLVQRTRATHLVSVPSLARALIQAPDAKAQLATLRQWVLSGEALDGALALALQRLLPECRFINLYGSSEIAADATAQVLDTQMKASFAPIGAPMANVAAYVLDDSFRPLDPGTEGELYIGGAGVAQGYIGRPALTAERFVPDPAHDGARMFRTGDRAARTEGAIHFRGRADAQLKINGHRIEPGEIEAAILALDAVADAAVSAQTSPSGLARLCAFVVLRAPLTEGALRAALAERLPTAFLPAAYAFVAELPRTASGKIDRRALPKLALDVQPGANYLSETEAQIGAIWANLLGLAKPPREANFFDCGGSSLLLFQLQNCFEAEFGHTPALMDLFRATTIAAQALLLEGQAPQRRAADRREALKSGGERLRSRRERGRRSVDGDDV
jgi:amino acid adenylation domain-containing protein